MTAPKVDIEWVLRTLDYAGEGRTNTIKPDLLANAINKHFAQQASQPPEAQDVSRIRRDNLKVKGATGAEAEFIFNLITQLVELNLGWTATQLWAIAEDALPVFRSLAGSPVLGAATTTSTQPRLNAADVLNVLAEMTDGLLWKQPEEDGHVSRLTERLNKLLEVRP